MYTFIMLKGFGVKGEVRNEEIGKETESLITCVAHSEVCRVSWDSCMQ